MREQQIRILAIGNDLVPATLSKPAIERVCGELGVELHGEAAAEDEGLRGGGVARDLYRARWNGPAIVVKFEPRPAGHQRWVVGVDGRPADLRLTGRPHRAAERPGHELAAETDAEHRHVPVDGGPQPGELRQQPLADAGVVPCPPRSTHGNDEVVVVDGRKLERHVGGAEVRGIHHHNLVDLEAALPQPVGDGADRAHMVMLHEQCFHGLTSVPDCSG